MSTVTRACARVQNGLRWLEAAYKDQARGWVGFNVAMSHKITAAADILLMPSRFEPCGLNQLYAMKYGAVPVAHATGEPTNRTLVHLNVCIRRSVFLFLDSYPHARGFFLMQLALCDVHPSLPLNRRGC